MDRIRRALNREGPHVPPPPLVYEPTARLVYSDLGLPELFAHAAARGGMTAQMVHVEDLGTELVTFLEQQGLHRVALLASPILRKVRLAEAIVAADMEIVADVDGETVLVTGCDAAVGETGSLVFRGGVPPGWRAAAARIVILEPKNLVPDLVDLLARKPGELALVSGPAAVRAYVLH